MYIRYNTYTITDYIIMLVRLFDPQLQELVPFEHTKDEGVDCFVFTLHERFLNMTDSDGLSKGPLTTVTDSHFFDVQVKDTSKAGDTYEVSTLTIPDDDSDERFYVTNVGSVWNTARELPSNFPLKIYLKRHTLPPRPLEEHYWTFYKDKEIVAKLTLRTAVVQKYNAAKEQLDAKFREGQRQYQETERARNAAKQQEADDLLERQRQFNEKVRAANAAKELEAANLRERQRQFNEILKSCADQINEQERQKETERLVERLRKSREEQEQKAREKAREQPRPAPSGEPAAQRQRFLQHRNLVLTRKRMAQELEDLKSEIRRVNLLTYEEAKTFQKQQMRIWHPDKRAGMDHTQEEREHAVEMFTIAFNIRTQRSAAEIRAAEVNLLPTEETTSRRPGAMSRIRALYDLFALYGLDAPVPIDVKLTCAFYADTLCHEVCTGLGVDSVADLADCDETMLDALPAYVKTELTPQWRENFMKMCECRAPGSCRSTTFLTQD